MRLAIFGPVLNHHQAPVADEFFQILGEDFKFIELTECHDSKGGQKDYSSRPYMIKITDSTRNLIHSIVNNYDVCIFAGYEALPYQVERLKHGKLSFDMGERWLKRGLVNVLSPRIAAMVVAYHLNRWRKKPAYKLCCSAFAANDCWRLRAYKGRCFKWGYFTETSNGSNFVHSIDNGPVKIMWCARFLRLKHPELVIEMARRLINEGYEFQLDIYGDEDASMPKSLSYPKRVLKNLIDDYKLNEYVTLKGNRANDEIIEAMRRSDIFLFTSDRNEGWGAVANESMSCGCVLVASDAIGSSPYLIDDGKTGLMFRDGDVGNLTEKVEWLLNHRSEMKAMRESAVKLLRDVWSPANATKSLIQLIESIKEGRQNTILHGPCSQA